MQEYGFLISIAGILFFGAMSPGPSFLVVAQNSLTKSRIHGVATAAGTALGVSIFALLASLGVTALFKIVPSIYMAFKILGGAYLVYLAYRIWSGAKHALPSPDENSDNRRGFFNAFLLGLATQLSNPKTALVIAGVFAAFVPANPPINTWFWVAVIAFVIDFSWYAAVAVALSNHRSRSVYERSKSNFDRIASVFLGLVGVRLIFS